MFANRFTVVLDANVLARVASRDLILSLAEAEFFRPRWTRTILDETRRAIPKTMTKRGFDETTANEKAGKACAAMERAFPEAMIEGHEALIPCIEGLPDPDDAQVLAAAIQCKASIIVTDNLRDFPAQMLEPYELEAKSADDFIADAIDLDSIRAVEAVKKMRKRLKNPALTADELLIRFEGRGLKATADALRGYARLL